MKKNEKIAVKSTFVQEGFMGGVIRSLAREGVGNMIGSSLTCIQRQSMVLINPFLSFS